MITSGVDKAAPQQHRYTRNVTSGDYGKLTADPVGGEQVIVYYDHRVRVIGASSAAITAIIDVCPHPITVVETTQSSELVIATPITLISIAFSSSVLLQIIGIRNRPRHTSNKTTVITRASYIIAK